MNAARTLIALLLLASAGTAAQASAAGKLREGNRWYKKGQFDKAVAAYREAQIAAPGNAFIDYNIGNALHRAGSYDDAGAAYQRSLSVSDRAQKARTYYNLGNNAYRQQRTDEAVDYYKKALAEDPADLDAKYNIEFINAVKCGQCRPKQQDRGTEGKEQGKQSKGTNGKGRKEQQGTAPERKRSGMSREDAQRILQYYDDADRSAAKKRAARMPQLPKAEEDW